MKRLVKFDTEASNINKIIVNQVPGAYNLKIDFETIRSPASNFSSLRRGSPFVLACRDQSITQQILEKKNNIIPYLLRQKTSDAVVFDLFTMTRKTASRPTTRSAPALPKRGFIKNLTLHQDEIDSLTVFVGVVSVYPGRGGQRATLVSMDRLVVLEDGSPVDKNLVLYEDKSKKSLWIGSSFQDNQGRWYKQEPGPITKDSILYAEMIPNTKVVFQSELYASLLSTLSNTFNDLYEANKKTNSKQAIVNQLKDQTRNYFSSLSFTKNLNIDLTFSFSFNRLDFYRNNGEYSKLIKDENEMIDSFEILSTKILRKRIIRNNPSSRLTPHGPIGDFDNMEHTVRAQVAYPDLFPTTNILTVAGVDPDMKDITAGLYAYGVELTILDNTQKKLHNVINNQEVGLAISAKRLEDLYTEMVSTAAYNPHTQALNQSYIDRYMAENKKNIIIGAITSYISALALFHKDLGPALKQDPGTLASKLFMLTNPLENGPAGVLNCSRLILDLSHQIGLKIETSSVKSASSATTQTQTSKLSGGSRIIKIKHYFNEFVDSDDLDTNGFDYLTLDPAASSEGLSNFKHLTFEQVRDLGVNEQLKYNNLGAPAAAISFTPNYFNISGHPYKINSSDPGQQQAGSVIASSILVANKYRNSPLNFQEFNVNDDTTGASTAMLSIIKNNLKVIEKKNCTISINFHDDDTGIFGPLGSPLYPATNEDHLDAAEKMSEASPFVVNKSGSTSLMNFTQNAVNNISQAGYYEKIQQLNNDMLSYLVQTDYFEDNQELRPPEIKNITDANVFETNNVNLETFSLRAQEMNEKNPSSAAAEMNVLLLGAEPVALPLAQELNYANYITNAVSASQITAAALKYGKIRKIQYLAGYKKLYDSVMMNSPLWVELTDSALNNFSQSGKTIVCKLAESYTEFAKYSGIKSSVYNEYFLIGPSSAPSSAAVVGQPEFTILPESSFIFLNKIIEMPQEDMKYATAISSGVLVNQEKVSLSSGPLKSGHENLYTSGSDFLLPNGERYIGYYHIHYKQSQKKNIAMAGKTHVGTPHTILQPVSEYAKKLLSTPVKTPETPVASGPASAASGQAGY